MNHGIHSNYPQYRPDQPPQPAGKPAPLKQAGSKPAPLKSAEKMCLSQKPGRSQKPKLRRAGRAARVLAVLLLVTAAWLIGWPSNARAVEVVTTGIIDKVAPEHGHFRLRSYQLGGRPLTFYRMTDINFLTVSGVPLTLEDLQPGMQATVIYVISNNMWVILKVILPDPEPVPAQPMDVNYYYYGSAYRSCYRPFYGVALATPPYRVLGRHGMWRHAP